MKMTSSVLIGAAILLAGNAYPYGHDGHYLVGAIADQMLVGTPTAKKVKGLIGSVKLATVATMPDEIKAWDPGGRSYKLPFEVTTNKKLNADLEAFLHANQTRPDCSRELRHHEYHFADVQVFDSPTTYSAGQVGTTDHDIVHMISFCIDVLTGKQSTNNAQKITQPVALVLLVHYVGDLHQPLHVGAEYFDSAGQPVNPQNTPGYAGDKGGNSLSLVLLDLSDTHPTHPGNLHAYWDDNAVTTAERNWAKLIKPSNPHKVALLDMAKYLKRTLPAGWTTEPTIDPARFPVDCADEILPIAQEAHTRLSFSGIKDTEKASCPVVTAGTATALASADYPTYAGDVVADEIQKAGHRLADLLQIILQ